MTEKPKSRQELLIETNALRARLEEAEEVIRAIHSGEVDAFVVAQSKNIHTLMVKGSDYPYRAMVDSMGEGAVTLIPDGTIFFCNSRFTEIVKLPFEKLIGSPFQNLIPPAEQAKFGDMLKESGQNIVRGEFRLQTSKGTHVQVQLSAHVLATEEVEGITIVATDLTDLKLAEQARWEAEKKLDRMLQSVLDGMIVVDLSGKFTYANPAAEHILEVQKDKIIGNYFFSSEWKQIDANFKSYSLDQLPLAIALREQREVNDLEHGIITPGGEVKWLSVNASPLLDDKGQIFGAIASIRDVTEQKKIAEILGESHKQVALQASLLDQVRNAVIAIDLDGKIFYWNKFAEVLYQWKREEVIGKPISEVIVPDEDIGLAVETFKSIEQIGYWEGEYIVRRKDGSTFPVQVVDTVTRDSEGSIIGFVGVSIDITERKRAEQEIVSLAKFPSENPNPVLRLNRDGILMYANAASEALLGKGGCAVGGTAPQFWLDLAAQGLSSGKNRTVDIQSNGKVYSIFVTPVTEPGYVNFYARDITESKQAEDQLIASEKRYRRLFEASQDGVILLDADTGEIFDVNPYLVKMLGYSYEDLIGKKLWEIGAFKDVSASQLAFSGLQENEFIRYEDLPLRSKDGQLKDVEFVSNVYLSDGKKVVQCNVRDITERIRAEEEIRSRNQELELLYNLSRTLADASDIDQVLDAVNRYAVENVQTTFSRIAFIENNDLVIKAAYPLRALGYDLVVGDRKAISALIYCQRILEANEPVILKASDPEVGEDERAALLLDYVSTLCLIPLRVGDSGRYTGQVLGLLMLGEERNEGREPISVKKLNLIRSVGNQAASAIRRMQLKEQTRRRLEHLSALNEIDKAITSGFDLKTNINTLIAQVIKQLMVDAADVLLFNSSDQTLEYLSGGGFRTKAIEGTRLRLGESHAGRAALERIMVHVSNLQDPGNFFVTPNLIDENFVSYFGVPLIAKGKVIGVLEVFHRAQLNPMDDWLEFLNAFAGQAAIAVDNAMLFNELNQSTVELTQAYDETIEGWSRALDLRDKETEGHSLRVTNNALKLARSFGLNQDELEQFRWGALLHDIGKMGVPDGILLKPAPLTDAEWVLMRKHPTLAYELLSPIQYFRLALDIPYCHHEKWDGTGYPRGLKGEQIPLAARIFALVDVWDALRSDRPYRPAWPEEKVLAEIQSLAGNHLDPRVVETFLRIRDEITD